MYGKTGWLRSLRRSPSSAPYSKSWKQERSALWKERTRAPGASSMRKHPCYARRHIRLLRMLEEPPHTLRDCGPRHFRMRRSSWSNCCNPPAITRTGIAVATDILVETNRSFRRGASSEQDDGSVAIDQRCRDIAVDGVQRDAPRITQLICGGRDLVFHDRQRKAGTCRR